MPNVDEYSCKIRTQHGVWSLAAWSSLVTLIRAVLIEWKRQFRLLWAPQKPRDLSIRLKQFSLRAHNNTLLWEIQAAALVLTVRYKQTVTNRKDI